MQGALWGKTNLRHLSNLSGRRVLLDSASHVPDGYRWHSLLHHMIDVGACAEALLTTPVICNRFEHITRCSLTSVIRARLVTLVMLHDFGKAQADFQDQIVVGHDGGVRGHVEPWLAALLRAVMHDDNIYVTAIADALDLASMQEWFISHELTDDENEAGLEAMLAASTFHHGGRMERSRMEIYDLHSLNRQTVFGVHPLEGLSTIMSDVRNLCDEAWGEADQIPVNGTLIHWFSGLTMIADWMGSGSERHLFPYWDGVGSADERWTFARERAARLISAIGIPVAKELGTPAPLAVMVDDAGKPLTPRPVQSAMLTIPTDRRLVLIEAPTGDGKTEAAIIRYLVLLLSGDVDSLFFAR